MNSLLAQLRISQGRGHYIKLIGWCVGLVRGNLIGLALQSRGGAPMSLKPANLLRSIGVIGGRVSNDADACAWRGIPTREEKRVAARSKHSARLRVRRMSARW